MLGIFWAGQQTQINHLARSNRDLSWIHIAFLFAVTLTPFSTMLLAEFIKYRVALLVYWCNIVLLGGVLYGSWGYAIRALAGAGAHCEGAIVLSCAVEDPVNHQRSGFKLSEGSGLKDPRQVQA